jgi:hypothetical protein
MKNLSLDSWYLQNMKHLTMIFGVLYYHQHFSIFSLYHILYTFSLAMTQLSFVAQNTTDLQNSLPTYFFIMYNQSDSVSHCFSLII